MKTKLTIILVVLAFACPVIAAPPGIPPPNLSNAGAITATTITATSVTTTAADGSRSLQLDSNTTAPTITNGLYFLNNIAYLKQNSVVFPVSGLLSATTIALNADADTTIFTVPTGKRCVLTYAILVVGADAGTTTISIGADGAETNFIGNQTLSALDAAYDAAILMPVPNATPVLIKSYAATTVIQAKVGSQAGGATNTLYLFGFLY